MYNKFFIFNEIIHRKPGNIEFYLMGIILLHCVFFTPIYKEVLSDGFHG